MVAFNATLHNANALLAKAGYYDVRHPAGASEGRGGEFAPREGGGGGSGRVREFDDDDGFKPAIYKPDWEEQLRRIEAVGGPRHRADAAISGNKTYRETIERIAFEALEQVPESPETDTSYANLEGSQPSAEDTRRALAVRLAEAHNARIRAQRAVATPTETPSDLKSTVRSALKYGLSAGAIAGGTLGVVAANTPTKAVVNGLIFGGVGAVTVGPLAAATVLAAVGLHRGSSKIIRALRISSGRIQKSDTRKRAGGIKDYKNVGVALRLLFTAMSDEERNQFVDALVGGLSTDEARAVMTLVNPATVAMKRADVALRKARWDERWPAGTSGGRGGEFAPGDGGTSISSGFEGGGGGGNNNRDTRVAMQLWNSLSDARQAELLVTRSRVQPDYMKRWASMDENAQARSMADWYINSNELRHSNTPAAQVERERLATYRRRDEANERVQNAERGELSGDTVVLDPRRMPEGWRRSVAEASKDATDVVRRTKEAVDLTLASEFLGEKSAGKVKTASRVLGLAQTLASNINRASAAANFATAVAGVREASRALRGLKAETAKLTVGDPKVRARLSSAIKAASTKIQAIDRNLSGRVNKPLPRIVPPRRGPRNAPMVPLEQPHTIQYTPPSYPSSVNYTTKKLEELNKRFELLKSRIFVT